MKLASTINWVTLPDSDLGVLKRFGVYMPPRGLGDEGPLNVLYLFRGHETEWLGHQDNREGLVTLLQNMIIRREIRPLVVVLPGFMPRAQGVQGVPVDWSADSSSQGVGNGRFEKHFFEVKEWIENNLPVAAGPDHVGLDGFSMGGYAALALATRHPEQFGSVGAFDGSFMWGSLIDPRRRKGGNQKDRLWSSESCAPFFLAADGWDQAKMDRHNPVVLVKKAKGARLEALRRMAFHITTVANESDGNYDRCRFVVEALQGQGLRCTYGMKSRVLHPMARHSWAWADHHLRRTLLHHDRFMK